MREEAEAAPARQRVALEDERGECSFYFVSADYLRGATNDLPVFQRLRREMPAALSKRAISELAAFSHEGMRSYCVVSHRWLAKDAPDSDGSQFRAVWQHVRDHEELEWVWFDFWSMPQGERTSAQQVEFDHMLAHVNLLYLGMPVLALLDPPYVAQLTCPYFAHSLCVLFGCHRC